MFQNPFVEGTRSSETPAWSSTQLLGQIAANLRWIQRHIQEHTYRTSAVHILLLIARRLRNKPHNAGPAQLALRQRRLGIESSSIIVQQGTALVAHRLDRLLAAQLKKLWSRQRPSMRPAGVLDRGSTNAIDATARSGAKTTPRAQAA